MGDPGLFVRDLRRSAGLTQRDLAYRVAVGFPHISKIEAGLERPSLGLCRSIALVLSVSGDHLAARFGYLPDWADELLREHPMLALLALARVSNAVTADEEALVEWCVAGLRCDADWIAAEGSDDACDAASTMRTAADVLAGRRGLLERPDG